MNQEGLFIALEGSDGAGKATQFNLLQERLKAAGYEVEVFDFPQYGQPSSYFVKNYLNGNYGTSDSVSPYTAALFYALDRYDAAPRIKQALKDGKVVLSNRYVGSNMAHQGSKFVNEAERRGFFVWEDGLEYNMLGIPRPTINIFLKVPAEISYELILKKSPRQYTKNKRDLHEADINHLKKSVEVFDSLCKLFPKDFKAIDCASQSKLLSIPEISNLIWEIVRPMLPAKRPASGKKAIININDIQEKKKTEVDPTDLENNNITLQNISLLAAYEIQIKSGIFSNLSVFEGLDDSTKFYNLPRIPKKLNLQYKSVLNKIISTRSELSLKLHSELKNNKQIRESDIDLCLRSLYPLATLSSLKITIDKTNIEKIGGNYLSTFEEEDWLVKQLTINLKNKITPSQSSGKQYGQLATEIVNSLNLNQTGDYLEDVNLISISPKNEMDILPLFLFSHTDLSLEDIKNQISEIPYKDKSSGLVKFLNSPEANHILSEVIYTWDVITDTVTMDSLLKAHLIRNLSAQMLTPRYGYKIPELIETFSLEDAYMTIFDLSMSLHNDFLSASLEQLAPYSLLAGHKRRWQFSLTAEELFSKQLEGLNPWLDSLVGKLRDTVREVHPMLATIQDEKPKELAHKSGRKASFSQKNQPSTRRK